jgi:hypothetical protein
VTATATTATAAKTVTATTATAAACFNVLNRTGAYEQNRHQRSDR